MSLCFKVVANLFYSTWCKLVFGFKTYLLFSHNRQN